MGALHGFPKVNIRSWAFGDADKWEDTTQNGITTYTLKPGQTDTVTVTHTDGTSTVVNCGAGTTVKSKPHDIVVRVKP